MKSLLGLTVFPGPNSFYLVLRPMFKFITRNMYWVRYTSRDSDFEVIVVSFRCTSSSRCRCLRVGTYVCPSKCFMTTNEDGLIPHTELVVLKVFEGPTKTIIGPKSWYREVSTDLSVDWKSS